MISLTQDWPGGRDPATAVAAVSRLMATRVGTQTPLLSIVVPCYNEQGNLGPLTKAIAATLEPLGISWEVLFVDDCSRDSSWQVVTELAVASPRVRGLRLAQNSGQSAAIWAGIRAARGQFVATMDADLQNVPADLPALMAALEDYDCVCGTRVATRKDGDSLVRRMASRFANAARNWVTHETISDSGCGYRVFRRECVRDLKYFRGMHRFIPTLIRMEGFTVTEVPITHRPRLSGRSHYGVWDRLLATSCDLLAVRWMQMHTLSFRVDEAINFSDLEPERREAAVGWSKQQEKPGLINAK
jgi:dolichol-phosphate mannosyltransferase